MNARRKVYGFVLHRVIKIKKSSSKLAAKIYGFAQGIPSNLKSETGQNIGVGKKSMLCVKKSMMICTGQPNITHAKSLFITYPTAIKIEAVIKLCEISYSL